MDSLFRWSKAILTAVIVLMIGALVMGLLAELIRRGDIELGPAGIIVMIWVFAPITLGISIASVVLSLKHTPRSTYPPVYKDADAGKRAVAVVFDFEQPKS